MLHITIPLIIADVACGPHLPVTRDYFVDDLNKNIRSKGVINSEEELRKFLDRFLCINPRLR